MEQYRTFEEYKRHQTFDDLNPGLYRQPEKVFPGRLHRTAFGNFDWWKQEKAEFDWYNVSNNQRDSFHRREPVNDKGFPVGPSYPLSRSITRIPSARRSRSENPHGVDQLPAGAVDRGFFPLTRKFVPPVGRFPLSTVWSSKSTTSLLPNGAPLPSGREALMASHGPYAPLDSVRDQVSHGFVRNSLLTSARGYN